eukprot:477362_1
MAQDPNEEEGQRMEFKLLLVNGLQCVGLLEDWECTQCGGGISSWPSRVAANACAQCSNALDVAKKRHSRLNQSKQDRKQKLKVNSEQNQAATDDKHQKDEEIARLVQHSAKLEASIRRQQSAQKENEEEITPMGPILGIQGFLRSGTKSQDMVFLSFFKCCLCFLVLF